MPSPVAWVPDVRWTSVSLSGEQVWSSDVWRSTFGSGQFMPRSRPCAFNPWPHASEASHKQRRSARGLDATPAQPGRTGSGHANCLGASTGPAALTHHR
eukprot:3753274-Rhodomonas_salina.2